MEVTFLGTSAGVPTRQRNVSAVALRLPERGEAWLFDCGEGTQQQILRSDLKFSQLARIFITHMHGDHFFGLPGLLATGGMAGHVERMEIYGPPEVETFVRESFRLSEGRFGYDLRIHAVREGVVYEDKDFTVTCRQLKHRIPAFGYRVTEHDRPGAFDVDKARALGIPSGPLYGRLKNGETVTLPDGRTFDGREFSGPPKPGRSFVYCTDTIYCKSAVELARGADVLVHEATYAICDEELARRSLHSTTEMAARVALEAGVGQLLITHFSPRYAPGAAVEPEELLREARATFPNTLMARDFFTYEIERRAAARSDG
ncbi:MAG TPA: ribonuclease Z [Pyrinomonadaceae bacterium]|nr:ribonuclease Z [Pyrinomonadaceae bacterium]